MKFPQPCDCVVQTVDVDGKNPPVSDTPSMQNSVVQSVNVNANRNRIVEWFLVALLTIFIGTILFLGMFLISKQSIRGYADYVQTVIKTFDVTTTNVVTMTNTVYATNKETVIASSNIVVFDVKWRNIKSQQTNLVQVQYSMNNQSSNVVGNVFLDIKLNEKTNSFVDYALDGLSPMKSKTSLIFLESEPVTNLAIRVTSVKSYNP
jgi:hypothetical protein